MLAMQKTLKTELNWIYDKTTLISCNISNSK